MARKYGTVPPLVNKADRPFERFLFYGTLTNLETLARVLKRSEMPELPHAVA